MTADVRAFSLVEISSVVDPEGNDPARCVEAEAIGEDVALAEENSAVGDCNSAVGTAHGDRGEFCPIHAEGIEVWV